MISLKEIGEELITLGYNVKYLQLDDAESIIIKIKKNVTIEKISTKEKMWSIAKEYDNLKTDLLELIAIAKKLKNYKGLEIKIISTRELYKTPIVIEKNKRTIFLKINNGSYRKRVENINELLLKIYLKEVLSKKRKE